MYTIEFVGAEIIKPIPGKLIHSTNSHVSCSILSK
jgi:hypothetical protein